jgi:CO dehydrogenase/acetyl-CoA synthase beta subunit
LILRNQGETTACKRSIENEEEEEEEEEEGDSSSAPERDREEKIPVKGIQSQGDKKGNNVLLLIIGVVVS